MRGNVKKPKKKTFKKHFKKGVNMHNYLNK